METLVVNQNEIDMIAKALLNGEIVAFPTDTIFGVACVYDDLNAIERLKNAKMRPETKPFPMMVSNFEQIKRVAKVTKLATKVIEAWMPGALTIVLNKLEEVPTFVTNGASTIAIRMTDDEFILRLINKVGKPLLVTSANISGQENTTSHTDVLNQLDTRINIVVEGNSKGARASTIVDLSDENDIKELRAGPISLDRIIYLIGKED